MKAAYWGYGLVMISMFGFFIFWVASRSTVYNQNEYDSLKSQVEAAVMDSIDWDSFKQGFYICVKSTVGGTSSVQTIRSKDDYKIYTCQNNSSVCDSDGNLLPKDKIKETIPSFESNYNCRAVAAEYVINDTKFQDVVTSRLYSVLNKAMTDPKVEVLDVIEYPPKVTVKVSYKQDIRNSMNGENSSYDVVNVINAVLEDNGQISINDGVPEDVSPAFIEEISVADDTAYISLENTNSTPSVIEPNSQTTNVVQNNPSTNNTNNKINVQYRCRYVNGKFYNNSGKVVSQNEFVSNCNVRCTCYNNKCYGRNGNVVSYKVMEATC